MTTLRIASPCHESWDAMTPNRHGRHCAACDKTVVDVTALDPAPAREYLRQELPIRLARGERVCVRAHADRSGRLLRPGVTRRLLTNGLAAVLAVTAAGFAGFGPDLGAAEVETPPPTTEPLPGRMGEIAVMPAPLTGDVMMGMPVPQPIVPSVTDDASGITVTVDPNTFVVSRWRAKGEVNELGDTNLITTCGIPNDAAHRPTALRLEGGTVVITCGDRTVTLDLHSGAPIAPKVP